MEQWWNGRYEERQRDDGRWTRDAGGETEMVMLMLMLTVIERRDDEDEDDEDDDDDGDGQKESMGQLRSREEGEWGSVGEEREGKSIPCITF